MEVGRVDRYWLVAGICAACALALACYPPWRVVPLNVWDYIEFLPLLRSADGLLDRFAALIHYYAAQGRMNPLFYLTFVLQFGAFGESASAWHMGRWVMMAVDVVLLGLLCRRFGLRGPGIVLPMLLLVVATPSVGGWIQLMAEPYVVGLFLVAMLVAFAYRTSSRWVARAVVLAALALAAFLFKEVAATVMVIPFALAVLGPEFRISRDTATSPRIVALGALGAVVVVSVAALILVVRARPEATGYGMSYGAGDLTPGHLWMNFVASTMVYHPQGRAAVGLIYPANLLALLVLVLGLSATLRCGVAPRRILAITAAALALPLLGAVVYLPWPKFDGFYALPFFLGPSLLLGAAVMVLFGAGGWRRVLAVVALVSIPGYAAIPAARTAATSAANIRLNDQLAAFIAKLQPSDTVVVLDPGAERHLPVTAPDLRLYARTFHAAAGDSIAVVAGTPCDQVPAPTPNLAYLSYSFGCGLLPEVTVRFRSVYGWIDWITLGARADTLQADLLGAPAAHLIEASQRGDPTGLVPPTP